MTTDHGLAEANAREILANEGRAKGTRRFALRLVNLARAYLDARAEIDRLRAALARAGGPETRFVTGEQGGNDGE